MRTRRACSMKTLTSGPTSVVMFHQTIRGRCAGFPRRTKRAPQTLRSRPRSEDTTRVRRVPGVLHELRRLWFPRRGRQQHTVLTSTSDVHHGPVLPDRQSTKLAPIDLPLGLLKLTFRDFAQSPSQMFRSQMMAWIQRHSLLLQMTLSRCLVCFLFLLPPKAAYVHMALKTSWEAASLDLSRQT